MQHVRSLKLAVAAFIAGVGALSAGSAAAEDVNMWDGNWHADAMVYFWAPFIYSTVELPPAAGGGTQNIDVQPSQYLKRVKGGALFDGSVRNGDFSIWTDLVFLNLQATPSVTKHIGFPGGNVSLPVNFNFESGLRASIFTLAPTYTLMHNDIGNLDILAGARYTSVRVNFAYQITAPPLPINRGGGLWPQRNSTDFIMGVKGMFRLTHDGKWYVPYEGDIGDGDRNWQWNAYLGVGYHFHWGDVTLGCRNFSLNTQSGQRIDSVRMTGPLLGALMRF
jgi:hypothetical protein